MVRCVSKSYSHPLVIVLAQRQPKHRSASSTELVVAAEDIAGAESGQSVIPIPRSKRIRAAAGEAAEKTRAERIRESSPFSNNIW